MAEQRKRPDYREAAEATLRQLDWCVEYLHRIRRHALARQLSRNCEQIRRLMADGSRDAA
jgi:hypothetical protein